MSDLSRRPDGTDVGETIPHESAALHVTGHALYTDDLVGRTPDCLHAWPVQAPHAHARVTALRADPAHTVPGVVRVLTAADVSGVNDAGAKGDEPLFPSEVMYHGHAVCWVLGETLEAARLGAAAVEVDYEPLPAIVGLREAIEAGSFQGGQPTVARGDVEERAGRVGVRLQRRDRDGRPGALLPRDPLLARPGRRGRAGLRAEQHPAPDRDAGDRGARARRAQPRGHRAVPADGRRLRRQGDAAPRVRRDRRARCPAHRPAGAGAAQPDPGHHHDRQAARFPRPVAGRVRRRGAAAGARRHADLRRRLEPRPLRAGAGPGAVPRRQRLLDPARPGERPRRPHPPDLADRVPRVRGTAGDAGGRGHPRTLRAAARDRPDRPAPPQLLRRRPGHAVRPARAAPRAGRHRLGAGPRLGRGGTPTAGGRGVQRGPRPHQARARGDAGEVRDLVQLHGVQPGRRAGARLQGRVGADQPRRHRDGPGAAHQDAPGGGDDARPTARAGPAGADPDRQGAQHLGHRRQLRRRPQRRRGQARLRADPGAVDDGGGGTRARTRRELGGAGPGGLLQPGAAVGRRLLRHRGPPLGLHRDAGPPVQVLRLRRGRRRGRGGRLHRRPPHAPGRHRARRRRLALPAGRPRPDRGRVRAGRGLADPGGPALGHLRRRRAGPAGHAGGQHLQAAEPRRDARGVQRDAPRAGPRGRRRLRLQGGRRAPLDAGLLGPGGDPRGGGRVRSCRRERRPALPGHARGRLLGHRAGARRGRSRPHHGAPGPRARPAVRRRGAVAPAFGAGGRRAGGAR